MLSKQFEVCKHLTRELKPYYWFLDVWRDVGYGAVVVYVREFYPSIIPHKYMELDVYVLHKMNPGRTKYKYSNGKWIVVYRILD